MAARPSDGVLFAVVQTAPTSFGTRRLVTVNPTTGVATDIGLMGGQAISSLAFRSNGVLYADSGSHGPNPETLFTVNTSTGVPTVAFALGNGADGDVIAFHSNGLLYHSSGNATALFESVDVDTQVVTPIGTSAPEMFAMGYSPVNGQLYGSDIGGNLFTIDIATGARTPSGFIDSPNDNRGLAFVVVCPTPSPTPTPLCPIVSTGVLTSHGSPSGIPINIPINTTDVTGLGVISADITFNYDTSVLSPVPADTTVTAGSVSPGATVTYNQPTPGTLLISVYNPTGFTGAGSVVDLHMKVIGPIGSVSPLTLTSF